MLIYIILTGVFIHPVVIAPSIKGRVSEVQKEGRKGSKSDTYKKPRVSQTKMAGRLQEL